MSEKPPERVFKWKIPTDWTPVLTQVIPSKLKAKLESELQNHASDFEYEDNISAFQNTYSKIEPVEDLRSRLPSHWRRHFGFVRMFHCCRTADVASYYKHGIKVLDASEAIARFRETFLENPRFSKITSTAIDTAIESTDSSRRAGFANFGLDDRFLIENCGHYLIYGSEYLQNLALSVKSDDGRPGWDEFAQHGKPTVLKVSVPIAWLDDDDLMNLGVEALHTWAHRFVHGHTDIRLIDYTVTIDRPLPPKHIDGHYHPECIQDPLRGWQRHQYKTARTVLLADGTWGWG